MYFTAEEQESLLNHILSNPVCGIILVDPATENGSILHVNTAYESMTGYVSDELVGKPFDSLHSKDSEHFRKKIIKAFELRESISSNIVYTKKDGSKIWVQINFTPVIRTDGSLHYYLALVLDITKSIKNKERIYGLAYYDQLTKVGNRHLLMLQLGEGIKQSDKKFALLFIDLDKFKYVNDTFGHGVGDKLLRMVASRIRRSIRRKDFLARLGGDEFIVIVKNIGKSNEYTIVADRIVQSLRKPFVIGDKNISISSSVGISVYPDDASNIEILLKSADQALYEAKREGGNKYH